MTTATIERLGAETESAYRALVTRTVNGDELSEIELREGLLLAGRDLPTFKRHVELIQRRREATAKMTAAQQSPDQAKGEKLRVEATRLRNMLDEFDKRYVAERKELEAAQFKAEADSRAIFSALGKDEIRGQRVLLTSCDPQIAEQIDSKARQLTAIGNSQRGCEQHRDDQVTRAANLEDAREELVRLRARKSTPEDRIAQQAERVKQRERALNNRPSAEELEASIAASRKQAGDLEASIAELERSRLLAESIDWS